MVFSLTGPTYWYWCDAEYMDSDLDSFDDILLEPAVAHGKWCPGNHGIIALFGIIYMHVER